MARNQRCYADVSDELNSDVKKLFKLPEYAQVDEYLVNMANYFPLILSLIDIVRPNSICEIGSDLGMTTKLLMKYCKENECILHSVDPCHSKSEKINDYTYFYKQLSLEYLEQSEMSQVYFIDGDHNYYTVYNELNQIRKKRKKFNSEDVLIMVHDIGWPCGLRDMYYDINTIPSRERRLCENVKSIKMFYSADDNEGLPMDSVFITSQVGGRVGVLTAVKDFLENEPEAYYFDIPSIFGLGVIVISGSKDSRLLVEFDKLKSASSVFYPLLSILEFNRIRLLEKNNYSGKLWEKQQSYISKLEVSNRELSAELEALRSKLGGC